MMSATVENFKSLAYPLIRVFVEDRIKTLLRQHVRDRCAYQDADRSLNGIPDKDVVELLHRVTPESF